MPGGLDDVSPQLITTKLIEALKPSCRDVFLARTRELLGTSQDRAADNTSLFLTGAIMAALDVPFLRKGLADFVTHAGEQLVQIIESATGKDSPAPRLEVGRVTSPC